MKYLQKVTSFSQELEEGVVYYSTEEDMVLIKPQIPQYTITVSANGDGCLWINGGYTGANGDIIIIKVYDYYSQPFYRSPSGDFEEEGIKYYAYSDAWGEFIYYKENTYGTYKDTTFLQHDYYSDNEDSLIEVDADLVIIKKAEKVKEQTLCYTEGDNQILTADTEIKTIMASDDFEDREGNITLTSIKIPNGVEYLSDSFTCCYNLASAIIPNSVTEITSFAFEGCRSLTSITIPDSVTEIGEYAFARCTSLTSITIPDSVTEIGEYAFGGCSSLTSIIIPDSVTSIGKEAFENCSSLASVTYNGTEYTYRKEIENALTENGVILGEEVFENTALLIKIQPTIVTYTDGSVVNYNINQLKGSGYQKATSDINDVKNAVSIVVGENVTEIGDDAFVFCDNLTSITLSNTITHIGTDAFLQCHGLTSITIPDSILSLGNYAFTSCSNLASVTYKGTTYTSKSALTTALTNNGVTVYYSVFSSTALTA